MNFGCAEFVIMGNFEGPFVSGSQILTKMQEGFEASDNKDF